MSENYGKLIDGRIINLDNEPLESLNKIAQSIAEKEETMKFDLDAIMNQMIN